MLNLNSKILKEATANLMFLGSAQVLNYVVPILMIPFLIENVGIESFGKISIIQTILFYSIYIVNYGFNYSGTIQVSSNKNENHSLIFSSIVCTKIALTMLASFLGCSVHFFFELPFSELVIIYLSFLLYLLANSVFPEWYFHGIQKLKYNFYIILVWKLLYIYFIFVFIGRKEDYPFVVLIDGVLYLIVSIGTLIFVDLKFKLKLFKVDFEIVKYQLNTNWNLFFSMAFTTFYTKGNFLFLGLCSTQTEVAIYAIAERYIFMINGLLSLFNRVILPYLTLYKLKSSREYFIFIKSALYIIIVIGSILFIINFFLAKYIAGLLNISYLQELTFLISILSMSFISSSFCNFVTTVLINENRSKAINKINLVGFIVGVFLVMPLTFFFNGKGLSVGFVLNSYVLVFFNTLAIFNLFKTLKK